MLLVLPEAECEVAEIAKWYESKHTQLGERFICDLDLVFARIQEHPERFPLVWMSARRALCRVFPYATYYKEADGDLVVLAVLHQHRSPQIWHKRLKDAGIR